MPALQIFGHRSRLGGDDLSPICVVIGALRLAEAALLVPAATETFIEYQERLDEKCMGHRSGRPRLGVIPLPYLIVSLCFAVFTICLSIQMYRVSGRGSPTQPHLRKGIGRLFAIQMFVTPLVLLAMVAVGISGVSYVDSRIKCVGRAGSKPTWFHLLVTILFFQCFELFVYALVIFRWLKMELRRRVVPRDESASKTIEERAEEWDNTCKCCCKYTARGCCFSFGGQGIENANFSSTARVLTELFDGGGTLDIVFTDLIAAFIGITLEQEDHKEKYIERLKREASDDPGAAALIDQATASSTVPLSSQNIRTILNAVWAKNMEAGMPVTTGPNLLPDALPAINMQQEENREKAFVFANRTENEGDKKFTIRELLSPNVGVDQYAIAEGARFLRYSIAINAAKGYIFANLSTNFCKLMYARYCELPKHRQQTEYEIVGEDSVGWNEASLMKVIGFDTSKVELLYAHLDNAVEQAVYTIAVDHVWESVVLCIRGSLSLEDYVINLQIDAEELSTVGAEYGFDGDGEYCHRGYLARAKWVCEDLKRHGILDRVLNKESGKYRDYILRVSGHSLGAGTAAPVAFMLRSQYPDLRCLCFAPPGGLLSEGIASRSKDFITTYVNDTDLVPRISTQTLEKLRDEALQMIARIKIPKHQLLKINRSGKRLSELTFDLEDLLHPTDAIPDSQFKTQLEGFKQRQIELQTNRRIHLFPPGRVVHLVKTMSSQEQRILLQGRFSLGDMFNCATCDRFVAEDGYVPRYAAQSDLDEIAVSSTLVSDHMVENVELALNFAAEAFGLDPNVGPPSTQQQPK